MSAVLDTNILIRHLTGDPPGQAARATALLKSGEELILTDVIAAEVVYVLESFYEVERTRLAHLFRSILSFPPITVTDEALLLRAIEVYEIDRLDYADAYLVACAETTGIGRITSFDRKIGRIQGIERIEPS